MIAKSRLSLATLVLAGALCLVQCGEVEKLERSLNNERDLFGAIALQKPPVTNPAPVTTTANVFLRGTMPEPTRRSAVARLRPQPTVAIRSRPLPQLPAHNVPRLSTARS